MSDVAATNCGCDCGCGCQSGGNGCNIIWLILILCCCGGGNGCGGCFGNNGCGNGCGCDIQKVRKQRGVYAPLFSFWKNSFFFFSLFSSSLSCLITSVFLFLYTFLIYFIYSIPVDHQSAIHNEPPFRKWTPKPFKSTSSYYNICMK